MATEKKESNRLYKGEWKGDTYHMACDDGVTENFNIGLASVKIHDAAKRYGFQVKLNRFFAVSIEEFPTKKARMEEGRRRMREWREHVYSGADAWDMPSKATGPRVTKDDIIESLSAAFPQYNGAEVWEKKLAATRGDKTPELAELEMIKYWLTTKQVATAWADIQAARKAAQAAQLVDVEDDLAALMGE